MADQIVVNGSRTYEVQPKTAVYLTVIVGDAQVGGTSLTWQDAVMQERKTITKFRIGKSGQSLEFEILTCTTIVKDVNDLTNHTSVTYRFTQGGKDTDFDFDATVSANGGFAVYHVSFMFIPADT